MEPLKPRTQVARCLTPYGKSIVFNYRDDFYSQLNALVHRYCKWIYYLSLSRVL